MTKVACIAISSIFLVACSAHLPQTPADLDRPEVGSKKTFHMKQDMRLVYEHVRKQIHHCFVENIFADLAVPMGSQRYFAGIDDSGQAAQIVLQQQGVQTYLLAKFMFARSPNGTTVETTTKMRQNEHLEPLFAHWIALNTGCKLRQ